ncbi:6-phosphofructokinase, partial [Staphylococcus aureus]|uniref:6-phosphofructokinase n=1 Tax=Staphylococcus aureus TaxID=1280 RepID=UPI0016428D5A
SEQIQTIPIPPTIHNHINPTHFTIPFHTPLNTIIPLLDKITHTPSTHPPTFIIQPIPPHSPHLALSPPLSLPPHTILLPQLKTHIKQIPHKIQQRIKPP